MKITLDLANGWDHALSRALSRGPSGLLPTDIDNLYLLAHHTLAKIKEQVEIERSIAESTNVVVFNPKGRKAC